MCSLSCIAERFSSWLDFCQWVTNGDSDVPLHIYHTQKLLARSKLQVEELVDMAEDLGALILCWSPCAPQLELLSYEEDGEVNFRVKLMLRYAVELISWRPDNLLLARYWVHVWVRMLNQDSVRLPMHVRVTFLPFILLKKLDFAWSTLKLPFNCFILSPWWGVYSCLLEAYYLKVFCS